MRFGVMAKERAPRLGLELASKWQDNVTKGSTPSGWTAEQGGDDRMDEPDEFIKGLLDEALGESEGWFADSLSITGFVSEGRTQAATQYGFEWLVNTALGRHALRKREEWGLTEIKVGQECQNKLKPDVSFVKDGTLIVIETKTVSNAQVSWLTKDVKKNYSQSTRVYLLAVSYPTDRTSQPPLTGTVSIHHSALTSDFHYYLYRKEASGL